MYFRCIKSVESKILQLRYYRRL